MCQSFSLQTSLLGLLFRVDAVNAAAVREQRCGCGGPLHAAPYDRKPRGLSEFETVSPAFLARFSFCCGWEGCRKRTTPPSVRFLDRRVWLGVLVVLLAAARQGATPTRIRTLSRHFGVSRRTIERWQKWWRDEFNETPSGRELRARIAGDVGAPPRGIVDHFKAWSDPSAQAQVMTALLPPTL